MSIQVIVHNTLRYPHTIVCLKSYTGIPSTSLLRTGVFALYLCGNRSGGAKPRLSASGSAGRVFITSW
jgi:hypothetical protein